MNATLIQVPSDASSHLSSRLPNQPPIAIRLTDAAALIANTAIPSSTGCASDRTATKLASAVTIVAAAA